MSSAVLLLFFEGGAKGRVLSGNILQNIEFEEYSLDGVSQVEMHDGMYSGGDEIVFVVPSMAASRIRAAISVLLL